MEKGDRQPPIPTNGKSKASASSHAVNCYTASAAKSSATSGALPQSILKAKSFKKKMNLQVKQINLGFTYPKSVFNYFDFDKGKELLEELLFLQK